MTLTPEAEAEMLKTLLSQPTLQDTIDGYNRLARQYDTHFRQSEHSGYGPLFVSYMRRWLSPEDGGGPARLEQLYVLDAAAGSGLLGQQLHAAGLRQMDALDASEQLLAIARERAIYRHCVVATLGSGRLSEAELGGGRLSEAELEAPVGGYDAVTMAGGFAPHHCPLSALRQLLQLLRPGGLLMFGMRLEHLVNCDQLSGLEAEVQAVESEGGGQCLAREMMPVPQFKAGLAAVYVIRKL